MIGPAIRNAEMFPPAGGWGVVYTLLDQEWKIQGNSFRIIFDAVKDIQKANNVYDDDESIWDELNEIWTARDPQRTIRGWKKQRPKAVKSNRPSDRSHWQFGPEIWGPLAWNWLHSFGCVFDKEQFLATIERIAFMLDPNRSEHTGCDRCFEEWKRITTMSPPDSVYDEASAARWSWNAHNQVNKKLGKRIFPWASAARRYGWKVDL